MKAKEYAERYIKEGKTLESLEKILMDFYQESVSLVKSRGVKTNSALFAVWDEIDQKWQAFCNKLKDDPINRDGFKMFVQHLLPDAHFHWILDKKTRYTNHPSGMGLFRNLKSKEDKIPTEKN